jgi:hypothetical protein
MHRRRGRLPRYLEADPPGGVDGGRDVGLVARVGLAGAETAKNGWRARRGGEYNGAEGTEVLDRQDEDRLEVRTVRRPHGGKVVRSPMPGINSGRRTIKKVPVLMGCLDAFLKKSAF